MSSRTCPCCCHACCRSAPVGEYDWVKPVLKRAGGLACGLVFGYFIGPAIAGAFGSWAGTVLGEAIAHATADIATETATEAIAQATTHIATNTPFS